MALLNEAMTSAMGGEASDAWAIGDACCQTLVACDQIADLRRASECAASWSRSPSDATTRLCTRGVARSTPGSSSPRANGNEPNANFSAHFARLTASAASEAASTRSPASPSFGSGRAGSRRPSDCSRTAKSSRLRWCRWLASVCSVDPRPRPPRSSSAGWRHCLKKCLRALLSSLCSSMPTSLKINSMSRPLRPGASTASRTGSGATTCADSRTSRQPKSPLPPAETRSPRRARRLRDSNSSAPRERRTRPRLFSAHWVPKAVLSGEMVAISRAGSARCSPFLEKASLECRNRHAACHLPEDSRAPRESHLSQARPAQSRRGRCLRPSRENTRSEYSVGHLAGIFGRRIHGARARDRSCRAGRAMTGIG